MTVPAQSSPRTASARCSSAIWGTRASIASRTQRRKSTATWSLRERPVCSRPAAGPTISARRPSTFIWMSSSARENENVPPSISPLTWARPLALASAPVASTTPRRAGGGAVVGERRRGGQIGWEGGGGGKVRLADFDGRAVLLNLWATWWIPCRVEMPALDRLQAARGGPGFEVVAVNVDTAKPERRAT